MKVFDTRSGEILSALISLVLAIFLLIAPDSTQAVQIMRDALPEWAIVNIAAALFCLAACFCTADGRMGRTARFLSGCIWGTFILIFASLGQLLVPLFGIAMVMFAFDVYLVTVKGQAWARSKF